MDLKIAVNKEGGGRSSQVVLFLTVLLSIPLCDSWFFRIRFSSLIWCSYCWRWTFPLLSVKHLQSTKRCGKAASSSPKQTFGEESVDTYCTKYLQTKKSIYQYTQWLLPSLRHKHSLKRVEADPKALLRKANQRPPKLLQRSQQKHWKKNRQRRKTERLNLYMLNINI